jgi:hypothetical protein
VTGGSPGYFNRHSVFRRLSSSLKPSAIQVASGPITRHTTEGSSTGPWPYVRPCPNQ